LLAELPAIQEETASLVQLEQETPPPRQLVPEEPEDCYASADEDDEEFWDIPDLDLSNSGEDSIVDRPATRAVVRRNAHIMQASDSVIAELLQFVMSLLFLQWMVHEPPAGRMRHRTSKRKFRRQRR
jgi:hypothetical protein